MPDTSPSSEEGPLLREIRHEIAIDPEHLRIEPFQDGKKVGNFDCGNPDLNDFLCSKEVLEYEEDGFGKTYLVWYQGELVAYFTVCSDGLRYEYLEKAKKSFSKTAVTQIGTIPSVKIGRLATDKRWQNKGVGRMLIRYLVGLAQSSPIAIRLLIVEAKDESLLFYLGVGFHFARPVKRERGKRRRTMLLDLHELQA